MNDEVQAARLAAAFKDRGVDPSMAYAQDVLNEDFPSLQLGN